MRSSAFLGLLFASALALGGTGHAVTIDWVTVGDPGNAAYAGYGSVPYVYRISKYEVTNTQYAEFLNAVAATDTHGLYHQFMADPTPNPWGYGGITRSGGSGSFTYNAIAGRESMPVNYVQFVNALRFANWLSNGQPTGTQDYTTTESGAYAITPFGIANNTITRNPWATTFLASEDEWYKAAYYDAVSASYFSYPAGTNVSTACAVSGTTANTANCDWLVGDLTDVGSYTGSASPNGTFDQGGNVWEWVESIPASHALNRGVRGGSFTNSWGIARASTPNSVLASNVSGGLGFRVGTTLVPEPGTALLFALVGLALWRRQQAA